ncbi:hypothetical protein MVEG_07821 [Podila verticillata NRRL 6337]|nr:hypothetical protein MVEG_07821 [Podila verticillata NRRL 6337]
MNYLHFDASDTYFLVQWFPMQTPFSLGVGLVFTSLVCISERLVTFRLEKASMRLHMLQNPTWSRPVRSRNNSASGPPTLAVRPDRSSAIRALAEKSCCYALANTFRLGYMLLAMSFHTGIICVIIASLTLTQFFLDFSTQVPNARGKGYQYLEASRRGQESLDQVDAEHEDDTPRRDTFPLRSTLPMVHSHDCV